MSDYIFFGGQTSINASKEAELYDYPETIQEIEQLREEIMEGCRQEEQLRMQSSHQSDPTATRATRLLMDKRLRRLDEVSHATSI